MEVLLLPKESSSGDPQELRLITKMGSPKPLPHELHFGYGILLNCPGTNEDRRRCKSDPMESAQFQGHISL
jgi:hypothetical protein